jgi:hypothetical protein
MERRCKFRYKEVLLACNSGFLQSHSPATKQQDNLQNYKIFHVHQYDYTSLIQIILIIIMHFTTIFVAAAAALASTASAAPAARDTSSAVANVVAVNGFGSSQSKTPVKIPFGKLTHYDLSITGLQLKSVTVNVPGATAPDVNKITCQMYKDQYGIQPGSAEFTKAKEALIATNAVQFGWVLCYVNVDSS